MEQIEPHEIVFFFSVKLSRLLIQSLSISLFSVTYAWKHAIPKQMDRCTYIVDSQKKFKTEYKK